MEMLGNEEISLKMFIKAFNTNWGYFKDFDVHFCTNKFINFPLYLLQANNSDRLITIETSAL